jgi:hypothetical protein
VSQQISNYFTQLTTLPISNQGVQLMHGEQYTHAITLSPKIILMFRDAEKQQAKDFFTKHEHADISTPINIEWQSASASASDGSNTKHMLTQYISWKFAFPKSNDISMQISEHPLKAIVNEVFAIKVKIVNLSDAQKKLTLACLSYRETSHSLHSDYHIEKLNRYFLFDLLPSSVE